jgi:Tfp pilus assembly PilM family ATPase
MSRALRLPAWLSAPQADVAIEIAHRRLTVAQLSGTGKPVISAFASETLPAEALVPALAGRNIPNPKVLSETLARAFERAGIKPPRRVALIVPDNIARVSLLPFEQMPAKQADLDQLIRWQLKKATPFPVEEAMVSYVHAGVEGTTTTLAVVLARRDVIAEYEAIPAALGCDAGIVDIASFNVINTALAAGTAPTGDWLLVCLAPESTTIAIMRGGSLVFHRHRTAVDSEPLTALVHQTAMYYEDRLGGTSFSRVYLSGGSGEAGSHEKARREITERLSVPVQTLDARQAASLSERVAPGADVTEAAVAPIGLLLRERGAA